MLLLRQQEIESAADTAYYGFVVLGATWIVFVVGMGSVLGVWEWAWDVPDVRIHFISSTAPIQWRGGGAEKVGLEGGWAYEGFCA